jgi:hypothetical protein
MNAMQAGLLAWTIEILVAVIMLLGLKYEENKVLRRRKKRREKEA